MRIVVTACLLLTIYALAPVDATGPQLTLLRLLIALAVVAVVVSVQVQSILSASYPLLRAIESVVTAILVFVIVFSLLYLDLSHVNSGYFSEPMDHVSAIYFTITVLATVGFGDITPKTDLSRAIVSIQMLLNLAFIAIIIRVFFLAAQTRATEDTDADAPTPASTSGHESN
jgi:hypothetical protein